MQNNALDIPSLEEVRKAQDELAPYLRKTAVSNWVGAVIRKLLNDDTEIFTKLEVHQYAGSFKARGALLNILRLSPEQRSRGVVAVSAGNHAIAVSFAAERLGVSAKVVMPESVSSIRIKKCRMRGAEVITVPDFDQAFKLSEKIAEDEQRAYLHPFEGKTTATGTATLGLEFIEQVSPELDAIIVSVGGGGLAAGVSSIVSQCVPGCKVYGVEPRGAASIYKSIKEKMPVTLDSIDTIATSLAAPYALPYSYSLCAEFLSDVCLVSDQQMCEAMAFLFYEMKLAVEPACAAVVAAMLGPLRDEILGKRVGLVLCGSSIDSAKFLEFVQRGEARYNSVVNSSS